MTGLAETATGVTVTLAEGGSVQVDVVIAGAGAEPETAALADPGVALKALLRCLVSA